VDAHSAMVMTQGFTQDQVKSIIEDIDGSSLIDDKTKQILHFSEKVTRHAYKVTESDIKALQDIGCTEEEVFEAVVVPKKRYSKRLQSHLYSITWTEWRTHWVRRWKIFKRWWRV